MPLRGAETSIINVGLTTQIYNWNEQTKLGITFSSTTGFQLPNSAVRCPNASWILLNRWKGLTPEQKETFVPFSPDFVVELISSTDDLKKVRENMAEYRDNGTRLGWLINRNSLSGETVLPEFRLNMQSIW